MKIGILTNNPHSILGRLYKETRTLVAAGHEVTVLARHKEGLPERENIAGANVIRVKIPVSRVPILKQFYFSRAWIEAGKELDVDAYVATDADVLDEAAICARSRGKKLVYDSYELFLNILPVEGRPLKVFYWWIKERWGIRKADAVIAANPERARVMLERYPFIKKIESIQNYPSIESLDHEYEAHRKSMRERLSLEGKTVFVFQGALNKGRGLEELAAALPKCKKMAKSAFLIIGDGSYRKEFEALSKDQGLKNLIFTGKVDFLELPKYLSVGDVGMVFYPPTCRNYIYAAPNKLYEYMMNRMAVLSNHIETIESVIKEVKNGDTCDTAKAEEFAETLDNFCDNLELDQMKERSFSAALKGYNWERQEQKLKDLFANI